MSLPKPYYDHAGIVIYHGDCREILPELPKVDLVLTSSALSIVLQLAVQSRGIFAFCGALYSTLDS